MDLDEYLKSHDSLCEFDVQKHEQEVFYLLEEHTMNLSGLHLTYERRPEFNKLLNLQGPASVTILACENKKIAGLFSVSMAPKYVQGQKKITGYIGDFRTNGSVQVARLWRKVYSQTLASFKITDRLLRPEYFLTAILADNKVAIRNLVAHKKDLGFYYGLLRSVDMVNIYGEVPFKKKITHFKVRFARSDEEERIRSFLDTAEKRKLFGAVFDSSADSEWLRRKESWPNFMTENFVVVENHKGEIIAVTLPWSPTFAKRMRVTKAPALLRWAFQFLKLFGYNMPAVGMSIETCYLTHLNIIPEGNFSLVINEILSFLIEKGFLKKYHMLSLADWWGVRLEGYIIQRVPVNLYAVTTERDRNTFEITDSEIGFEMGLV